MDQLGNRISMILAKDVLSIYEKEYRLSAGKSFFNINTDDFEIEQDKEEDETGTVYTQSVSVIANISEAERLLFHNQDVIVRFISLRGNLTIWGTKEYPVHCTIIPNINNASLELSCRTVIPLSY